MTSSPSPEKPLLEIRVDVRQFDEAAFEQSLNELKPHFTVTGTRSIKLADQAPLLIVLMFALDTLKGVPGDVVSSILSNWVIKWTTYRVHREQVTVVYKVIDGKDTVIDLRVTMPNSNENRKKAEAAVVALMGESNQPYPAIESGRKRKNRSSWHHHSSQPD